MALSIALSSAITGVAGAGASGCVLAPVDPSGRPCPCADGWACDETTDRCVRPDDLVDAGAPVDAGDEPDAASPIDARPPIDAPVDDPTTECDDALAGAFFCESFEDPSLLFWRTREASSGSVGYSSARAWRGVGSLGATTSAGGGYAERLASVVGGVSEGDLYVRAYVFVPDGPPLAHASILHVGGHRSRSTTEPLAGFNAIDGFASMYVGAAGMHVNPQLVVVPRDTWFCVQFHLHVDDVAGVAEIWIDGEPAGELRDIDTRTDVPYETLGAGIAWSVLDQEPFEVSIDELALSHTPLPCE